MVAAMVALGTILLQAGQSSRCLSYLVSADGKRVAAPAFKGVELYSWTTPEGTTRFSLLWGTNRLKTESEIKLAACALSSATQVKSVLSVLAEGEQVYWGGDPRECPSCSYPSRDVVADLVAHGSRAGITVHTNVGRPGK